jgi:hypothetical protein
MIYPDRISPHISFNEATYSETALRNGIANLPNENQLKSMRSLAYNVFEPAREKLQKKYLFDTGEYKNIPIWISSFFRHPDLNKLLNKASKRSQHMKGEAMDIYINPLGTFNNEDLFNIIKDMDFDQLIWEYGNKFCPAWIHVSWSEVRRKRIMRAVWNAEKEKTDYFDY